MNSLEFTEIIEKLKLNDVSPGVVVRDINAGRYDLDREERWQIGEYIYNNYRYEELDADTVVYASRAFRRSMPLTVVANSSDALYWGISRDARNNAWRPFYRDTLSTFSFRLNKFTGRGWKFAEAPHSNRVIFAATTTVGGEEHFFGWELLDDNLYSPIARLMNLEPWFDENRFGSYVINKIDKTPDDFEIKRVVNQLDLKKQHTFSSQADVYMFLAKGGAGNLFVEVQQKVLLHNNYLYDMLELEPGMYSFKIIPIIIGARRPRA